MPKETIARFIDFFYPPFRKIMPLQTFRYAACGGTNAVVTYICFTMVYHRVDNMPFVDLGLYSFKPYRFSLFVSSTLSFIIGFLLNKYVVFTRSNIKGHVQLFRYFLAFLFSFFTNNVLLQFFVENLHIYATISQLLAMIIIVGLSYIIQHYFTFRVKEVPGDD